MGRVVRPPPESILFLPERPYVPPGTLRQVLLESAREHEVPEGEVWVHCEAGYRAAIGASLMDRAGRSVVHIDDDWPAAGKAGNNIVT